MADKHPRIPVKTSHRPGSAPLPHPGLHDGYTRVSSGFASCLTKEKPILMKKEAVLTGFAPLPERSPFLSYN